MKCKFAASQRMEGGFTRADLIAAAGILFLLVTVSVGRLGRADGQSELALCLGNHRALALAWTSYANDHAGLMANNLTIPGVESTIAAKTYLNWANNVMTWAATGIDAQSTTNLALVATSPLFSYLQSNVFAFKCPVDTYLSPPQRQAGWQWRTRSYSMNAFMGQFTTQNDPAIKTGKNTYFPAFRQFLQLDSIPNPGGAFVFTEEHPDSINDGFSINDPAGSFVWGDLPASYHDGGCSFAFADGHAELRRWESARTAAPVRYNYVAVSIPSSERMDYQWVAARTSVDPTKLATHLTASNQLRIVWSALPTNYALQASTSLAPGAWTNVSTPSVVSPGERSVTLGFEGARRFFRLKH